MSRRFRDQASSVPSTNIAASQSHRSPAPVPLSSRFARPSSSQYLAPTPGSSIARFRDRPRVTDDEIETSFELAGQSSPPLPSRPRLSSSASRRQELVDDLDDEEDEARTSVGPQRGYGASTQQDEDDGLSDLEFLETLRGTRTVSTLREQDADSSSSESEPFTPTISRKRRRLHNRTDHDLNSIECHESHEQQQQHLMESFVAKKNSKNRQDEAPVNASSSSDLEIPSSPIATSHHHMSSKTPSRFKVANQTPASASLNHTTTTQIRSNPRPSFRPPPDHHRHHHHHHSSVSGTSSNHLPPTFSPSHRGGRRKDYLPGGAADTVRNRILGLAAAADQRRGQGIRGVEEVRIASTLSARTEGRGGGRRIRDGWSGKCMLAVDDLGRKWCLIGPEAEGGRGSVAAVAGEGLISRNKDCVIQVRMGWDLDLGLDRLNGQGGEGGVGGGSGSGNDATWKIAVLWDVLDA